MLFARVRAVKILKLNAISDCLIDHAIDAGIGEMVELKPLSNCF